LTDINCNRRSSPYSSGGSEVEAAMKVVDVVTRRVITVTPNASILQCGATDSVVARGR
jgi:hypothetical protein